MSTVSRDKMPCSHWSVPHPHVLARLAGPRPQPLGRPAAALVQGRLLVLVLDGDQRPRVDQLLGDVCVAPEAGVVQRRVAVLVHEVHVRLLSQQLENNRFKIYFISLKIFQPTVCTTSRCPCAAPRCSGVSSPMLVVWTRAPRPSSSSRILRWPPLAAQCSGENWWSSLQIFLV